MTGRWIRDDRENVRLYTERVERYGADVKSVNWGSRESQRARFAVFADLLPLDGCSVLDVGCGAGDFLQWLEQSGIDVRYTGLDITPAMIDVCGERFPSATFLAGSLTDPPADLAPAYDIVVASGIFTYRPTDPLEYVFETVSRMFERSTVGAAFNALSAWTPVPDPEDTVIDPAEALAFCTTLTPWVALRHDYMPHDFTIALRHEAHRA